MSQRASTGWRPAWTAAAWIRVISLALICACAGLIWSSATASADTGHRSGAPLVTGIRSVGRTLGGTGNGLLGSHRHPRTNPPLIKHPLIKHPLIKHPLIKHHLIKHHLIKHHRIKHPPVDHRPINRPKLKQPKIAAHPHRAKNLADTDNDAGALIGNVTGAVGNTVHSTSRSVHGISSRVGSTADPVERAGHRLRAGHRPDHVSASVGGVAHSVGSAVHGVGSTADAVGSVVDGTAGVVDAVDHPDRLGAASGDEVRRVSGVVHATDDVVGSTGAVIAGTGRTVRSLGGDSSEPVASIVEDLGDAVTSAGSTTVGTLGDTVTGLGNVVGATTTDAGSLLAPVTSQVQPYGQGDVGSPVPGAAGPVQRTVPPESLPARHAALRSPHTSRTSTSAPTSSAPPVSLLMTTPAGATTIEHASGHRGTRPVAVPGALLPGLGGGPVPDPGQLPQPTGEMITAPASGVNGHQHGMLRAAINGTIEDLADILGSSSAQPHATPYDPGYSPD